LRARCSHSAGDTLFLYLYRGQSCLGKNHQRVTGVWEKAAGSGVWWIRYRVDGKLKREKVGRKGAAIALYQQRKSEVRAGKKLPTNLRNAGVKFKELADAILVFSASHHRDTKNIRIRLAKISAEFGERVADSILPEEIDGWLSATCKTPATANRYWALFLSIRDCSGSYCESLPTSLCWPFSMRLVCSEMLPN